MLFDWLVIGQVVATNLAHSVRGPKHVVKTGKTTVLTGEQARELLDSIDTSTVVGLRDRALIRILRAKESENQLQGNPPHASKPASRRSRS